MKKQLSNKIQIIPVIFIASQTTDKITPTNSKYLMSFYTGDPNFQQNSDFDQGNRVINQSDERDIDSITEEQEQFITGEVAVILEATDGTRRVWGSRQYPVRCRVNYDISGIKILLERKASRALLF